MGSEKHITQILPMLKSPERDIQVEAIKALSQLTDARHVDVVRKL